MKKRLFPLSLTQATALMVLTIAVLAAASLWMLRRLHNRQVHFTATQTVLHVGRLISARLANELPRVTQDHPTTEEDWTRFSRLVQSLYVLENGLQYVSVIDEGVTVFHEQTGELAASGIHPSPALLQDDANIRLGRKRLVTPAGALPVVTFSIRVPRPDGGSRQVEVALRKDTVERKAMLPAGATVSMFRVALITVLVSFAICVAVVVWMMHREVAREKQRREEEHLAFAGVMAGGVVHDFRNPMSSLRLDVQLLDKEASKGPACRLDRVNRLAERAKRTMDRMDRTFQEFSYLSRQPQGERERLALTALVRECADMLAPRYEQKHVRLDLRVPDAPLEVYGHAMPLRRALLNIMTNALQFTPEQGRVTVRVARQRHHALVDISDSGPGIRRSDRSRVFELFFSTRPGGSGLGLFLARKAIEKCGGSVEVRTSNREPGACIRIHLPVPRATGRPVEDTANHEQRPSVDC